MKSAVLSLVAIVVLAGGAWLIFGSNTNNNENNEETVNQTPTQPAQDESNDQQDEATPSDAEAQATVTYSAEGFSPNRLNVVAGDTVEFVNNSSSEMWVASDDHPTHDELAGFDQMTSVGNGERYVFTFNEGDTWGYHNHLIPNHTGEIVVEEVVLEP